jgi:hypothetical protein
VRKANSGLNPTQQGAYGCVPHGFRMCRSRGSLIPVERGTAGHIWQPNGVFRGESVSIGALLSSKSPAWAPSTPRGEPNGVGLLQPDPFPHVSDCRPRQLVRRSPHNVGFLGTRPLSPRFSSVDHVNWRGGPPQHQRDPPRPRFRRPTTSPPPSSSPMTFNISWTPAMDPHWPSYGFWTRFPRFSEMHTHS